MPVPLTPGDLAKFQAPNMAFSKIQNVRNLPEEDALEFFNGLYQAAVMAKDDGNWETSTGFPRKMGAAAGGQSQAGRHQV